MVARMKTPGVYIVERDDFPNSIVAVPTAVPAFVGYTEKAARNGESLLNKPVRITSMAEFRTHFGMGPSIVFGLAVDRAGDASAATVAGQSYKLERRSQAFFLYYSMLLFYQNGGGSCYVVSVGNYDAAPGEDNLIKGIESLANEQEPTMIIVPDAVLVGDQASCAKVQRSAIQQCGKVGSRVTILDVKNGFAERGPESDCIADFRNGVGLNDLGYAAAYYPWIQTAVVTERDCSYLNFDPASRGTLKELLTKEIESRFPPQDGQPEPPERARQLEVIADVTSDWSEEEREMRQSRLNAALLTISPLLRGLLGHIADAVSLLPASGAVAGVYNKVDNARGVWKAPANVSLNGVIRPAVAISDEEQEDLNAPSNGKSVNAIRNFVGKGVLIWGARTLDGNSLDWRYINVRRTVIMLEQSIKLAAKAYVFEPNEPNTWVTMKAMIQNFLTGIWKAGGLAGAVPDDAFSVHVGLGETMTPEDIREGVLRVNVLIAPIRPAEFIEIRFWQQQQQS